MLRFDETAVARVRSQLLAELGRNAREPRYISSRLWWRNVFDGHAYARPVRGTPESIARVAIPDLRAVVHDRLGRDVMIIGVVGDVTADALKTLLDTTFGSLPAHAAVARSPMSSPRQRSRCCSPSCRSRKAS